jgi:hypothetical protein
MESAYVKELVICTMFCIYLRETLIDASKEIGLEIHVEKTKYMLLSRHQNVGQNRDIGIANRSFGHSSNIWGRL